MANTWADFQLPEILPGNAGSNGDDVVSTTSTAPRTRNVEELSARIRRANGALVVNVNDSDYIVAVNNRLRFSIARTTDGRVVIRESQNFSLLIGLAVIAGLILIMRSR